MKRFVVLGHKAPVDVSFSLDDLPGGAGRLDVLCRAVGASLLRSHAIRTDVEAILLLRDSVQIRIVGAEVKRLNPDERSTAALIRRALEHVEDEETQSTPGVFASRRTLSNVLDRLYQLEASPIVLCEQGTPAESFSFPLDPAFILSDHLDFTEQEDQALCELPHVALGTTPLHTSQCITVVHYLLDQREQDLQADLVLCHVVWAEPKAQLIRGLLEDFNLPVNLVRHVPPSIYPVALDGLAEVRIMVRPRDLERARAIIRDYFEEPVQE